MTYRFVRYSPEYKTQIAVLRGSAFGGDPAFNTEYFHWKYEQNPYLKEPHFYVALYEEKVVAMRGFYGSKWQAGKDSESLLIPVGGDLAVDFHHRRHKVASRMLAHVTKDMTSSGYRHLMNLSANAASRRLQIRSGYPRVAPYRTFRRGEPSTTFLARGYRRVKRKLIGRRNAVPFRQFDNWAARMIGAITGACDARSSEMGELVLKSGDSSRLQLIRDATFYQWRFRNPGSEYRFIFFDDGGRLAGFLVLQSSKLGGWTTIIDWESLTPAIWTELVAAAIKSNLKQLRITSTAFTDGQIRALQSHGFVPFVEADSSEKPAPGMLLHVSSHQNAADPRPSGLQLLAADNWDVRMIASDAY